MKIIPPFFDDLHIDITWQELDNPEMDAANVEGIMKKIAVCPYLNFDQIDFDNKKKWVDFDLDKAIKFLASRYDAGIRLISSENEDALISFSKNKYQNTVVLSMDQATFERRSLDEFKKYMREMAAEFPHFQHGSASADSNTCNSFYLENQLNLLPKSMNYCLSWYTLVSPKGIKRDIAAQKLLATPAYAIETLPNDYIEMFAYEKPFDCYGEAASKEIITISTYLNDNAYTGKDR